MARYRRDAKTVKATEALRRSMTLEVTFLGTSGAVPTPTRNPIGILLRREGDRILLDVGEGIQRQMMRFGTGFGLDHIVITHLHGDHYYGLPGLLETLEFNDRERSLSIHVPARRTRRLTDFIDVTIGETSFPILVNGLQPGSVAIDHEEYRLVAIDADHDTESIGVALIEDDRPGRFDKPRALELGVPEGPLFGRLQRGESVELEDGTVVSPSEVLGDPRPGRTVVYTGDTRPTDAVEQAASEADLLIHEATFGEDRVERAHETGHSTARQAGSLAARAEARRLALTHTSSRYAGERDRLRNEAEEAYGGPTTLPGDGDVIEVPYPDE